VQLLIQQVISTAEPASSGAFAAADMSVVSLLPGMDSNAIGGAFAGGDHGAARMPGLTDVIPAPLLEHLSICA